ncbi:hypothetical protein [Paraburkholderia fungorum]|uniref:hypothetical protein n=1 Tax=Paraburkholderia fungorum TaxID=134537 RepID=UPI0038BC1533
MARNAEGDRLQACVIGALSGKFNELGDVSRDTGGGEEENRHFPQALAGRLFAAVSKEHF